jgi:hypothetical protein
VLSLQIKTGTAARAAQQRTANEYLFLIAILLYYYHTILWKERVMALTLKGKEKDNTKEKHDKNGYVHLLIVSTQSTHVL